MAPLLHSTNRQSTLSTAVESSIADGFRKPVRAQTIHEQPQDSSVIPYEDEYQKLNSSLQIAWAESMNEDCYTGSTDYKKVEVLMLNWEEESDDLKVKEEVSDLRDVFIDIYHFNVTQRSIKKNSNRSAQTQVNAIVAMWVNDHDAVKTLLLVYFAGHGKPTKDGELELNGYMTSPLDMQARLNKVVWNHTEYNLRNIQSDVLEIFDCCYAGTLMTRGPSTGAFEYMAACASDDTTARPGEKSFTAALIWALKQLAEGSGRFTTVNLVAKVREAPNFPPDQRPMLDSRREDHTNERIVLHPLSDSTKVEKPSLGPNWTIKQNTAQQEIVTLKFVFDARPSVDDVKKLGNDLNHVVYRHKLNVNRIIFGGIRPQANDAFFTAINQFKARGRSKASHPAVIDKFKSQAVAAVGTFVDTLHEEVVEEVHEQVQQEFEAHTAQARLKHRASTD